MAKSNPTSEDNRYRGVVLAVVLLTAFLFAIAAGLLSWIGGTPVALSILAACAAFGGSAMFLLTILRYAHHG